MSILSLLQQAQQGQGLSQLAGQFGLDSAQANELTGLLAPALGKAAKQQAEGGNLEALLGTLKGEDQADMFDNAASAASPQGQANGLAFLGTLLGGGSAQQTLTEKAAAQSGIDANTVAQFLPALASMLQGGLQKNLPDAQLAAMQAPQSAGAKGLMGMVGGLLGGQKSEQGLDLSALTGLLDSDADGSVVDDLLEGFLKR
ncbi:DUF937 domain-containing protein [uncultured Shimia sp.]|uniref:DUF937 domain-containing protein n=1 Tax=uncultured Shimia sp. TaxID=573152 RepID=UPI002605E96A|nr:DUF937 domain-containing protein [uncultured Shimia sp.]